MLIVYDLDKTSLYCPIADFLDKFIPKNKTLKVLYYSLYPFIHNLEMKLGLLKINNSMYARAKSYAEFPDINQIVVTARHFTKQTLTHVQKVFHEIEMPVICIAQGLTELSKAEVIEELPLLEDEEIVMFDDNNVELSKMKKKFKNHFTGMLVKFKGKKEYVTRAY